MCFLDVAVTCNMLLTATSTALLAQGYLLIAKAKLGEKSGTVKTSFTSYHLVDTVKATSACVESQCY